MVSPGCSRLPLAALLLLSVLILMLSAAHAQPVSSPEIPNKAIKTVNSVQQQQLQQLQQQQQQQLKPTGNAQDAHLNTLSVFATNYDSLSSPGAQAQVQVQGQGQPTSVDVSFKPSYKMPEMETNFTPMQQGSVAASAAAANAVAANLPSTPMLMQYLPAQSLQDGGGAVQYLQLIPTRPIIVPISPYLTPGQLNDYTAAARPAAPLLHSGLHYTASAAGLHGYASAVAPAAAYRSSYRINREAKDKHFPATFSLNLNEYLPASSGGHDAAVAASVAHAQLQQPAQLQLQQPHLYLRGRS